MKKLLFQIFALLLCGVCMAVLLAACSDEPAPESGEPPAHTHAFGDWTVTTPATCTAAGVKTRSCSCGETETEEIAATGTHTYGTDNKCITCSAAWFFTEGLSYEAVGEGYAVSLGQATATEIVLPYYYNGKPVTQVAASGFASSAITDVLLTSRVTTIASDAFANTGLKTLVIPESVTSIAAGAFAGCGALEHITVITGNETYHVAGDCLIETDTGTLLLGTKNSVIPMDGSVSAIADRAFAGCVGLESISIPAAVTAIGKGAFSGCTNLAAVVFGATGGSWYVNTVAAPSGGIQVPTANAVTNAGNLTGTLVTRYWYFASAGDPGSGGTDDAKDDLFKN
ncbi:MAG: leucine-rich repeat domain-containing protein [Clostridia bacterium]|nr:leucine-rich repeat domain-containing protein [Clostridia bacterium]